QSRMLPVLVMTLTFSRWLAAVMLPSRQSGDLLAGMWQLISQVGAVSKSLVWDREAAIAPQGKSLPPVQGFAGTVATKMVIAPRRDPEFKGMTERNNQYFETSFLPGRDFRSPQDFNAQLSSWLAARAHPRKIRSLGDRPRQRAGPGFGGDDCVTAASTCHRVFVADQISSGLLHTL